jgi:HAD superfamily hydrolase (TIGR01549 family)
VSPRPSALLLDFGGVCYTSIRRHGWRAEVADAVEACLRKAGSEQPTRDEIERDLEVARVAEHGWKTAASRTAAPAELTGLEYWGDFVASDWPAPARAALVASSLALSRLLVEAMADYELRPGTRELLEEAARQGIPVAIVSNTRSGTAFRDLLARDLLTELISLHVYSDEVGIRKPNPEMLRLAARGLGLAPSDCWYGGDHYDRDVMCARRAGIGVAVLVHDTKTLSPPYAAQVEPDLEVASPLELAKILADGATPRAASAPIESSRDVRARGAGRPAALLLDHGGVIADSRSNKEGRAAFAQSLLDYLIRTGWKEFELADVEAALEAAQRRHGENKDALDASFSVPEVSHLEYFRDLVAADWPEHPRAALAAESTSLMIDYVASRSIRTRRPGVLELLSRCSEAHIPVGIVSNTLCGKVVRDLSREFGTAPYLGVEIYSDELGFRKPDPATLRAAATALGVELADCWYVGDKPNRDVLCARRAGVGKAVLMERAGEAGEPTADLVVRSAAELLAALEAAIV